MGNQKAYDLWGGISTTAAGLIVPVGQAYAGAKMSGLTGRAVYGAVGKTFVKELSYDIAGDVIGSGTSSFVFDLTGNVNLSRLAGLSAGMMTSGKSLNHVDNVTSSTVKGLNHADNFTSTSKKFDRFAKTGKKAVDATKSSKTMANGGTIFNVDELVVRDKKFLDANGDVDWEKWAPNGGRISGTIKKEQTLVAGTIIDRYGNKYGKYTSPEGVPYEKRALPYIENSNAYHKYEVIKPIDNVTISNIAEAFEQPGGGIQYELPSSINQLLKDGYLKEIC